MASGDREDRLPGEPCQHYEDIEEFSHNPTMTYEDCVICGVYQLNEDKARDVCEEAGKNFSPLCYALMRHDSEVYELLRRCGNAYVPPKFESMRQYAQNKDRIRIARLNQVSGAMPETCPVLPTEVCVW